MAKETEILREALELALRTIDLLSGQQAMADDFYIENENRLKEVLDNLDDICFRLELKGQKYALDNLIRDIRVDIKELNEKTKESSVF